MDEVDLDLIRDMYRYSETAIRLLESASTEHLSHDERTSLAVWQALQIVGEAASRISKAIQRDLPDIPWQKVIGMRHHLVNGYRQVRVEIIARTVREDLPPLVWALAGVLKDTGR